MEDYMVEKSGTAKPQPLPNEPELKKRRLPLDTDPNSSVFFSTYQ